MATTTGRDIGWVVDAINDLMPEVSLLDPGGVLQLPVRGPVVGVRLELHTNGAIRLADVLVMDTGGQRHSLGPVSTTGASDVCVDLMVESPLDADTLVLHNVREANSHEIRGLIVSVSRPDGSIDLVWDGRARADRARAEIVRRARERGDDEDLVFAASTMVAVALGDYVAALQDVKARRPRFDRPLLSLLTDTLNPWLVRREREWTVHGVGRSFRFWSVDEKRDYLTQAAGLAGDLARLTPHVCFGFGAALAVERDHDLIPHDDDLDLIVAFEPHEAIDLSAALRAVEDHLRSLGYRVAGNFFAHRHAFAPGGRKVDVFVGLFEGDSVSWYPGPRVGLSRRDIFPVTTARVLGVDVPMPRDAPTYLASQYGPGWHTPDPTFRHTWARSAYHDQASVVTSSEAVRSESVEVESRTIPELTLPHRAVELLLPSLGFFGGTDTAHLTVSSRGPVRGVRLRLPDDGPRRLELRGIRLSRDGGALDLVEPSSSVDQSSAGKPELAPTGGLRLSGIRTFADIGPWWSVVFDDPLGADTVHVFNRRGGQGVTSRQVRVDLLDIDGVWQEAVQSDGDDVAATTVALIERIIHRSITDGTADRTDVMAAIATIARQHPLTHDAGEQRLLCALIPTAKTHPATILTEDEMTVLANLLLSEHKRLPHDATSLRAFQHVLFSRTQVMRLRDEVARNASGAGAPSAVVTAGRVLSAGMLRRRVGAVAPFVSEVLTVLRANEIPAVLGDRTLRSWVIDRDFPFEANDVDLAVPVDTSVDARAAIRAALTEAGFGVRTLPAKTPGVAVMEPMSRATVRVLHVGADLNHAVGAGVPADLRGQQVAVPADPESFLHQRMGDEWWVHDPLAGWPYRLSEPEGSAQRSAPLRRVAAWVLRALRREATQRRAAS